MKRPGTLAAAWMVLATAPISVSAADDGPAFRQIYIGEIGHFGTPYGPDTAVQAIGMTITRFSENFVVIRGKDDAGKAWRVVAGVSAGVGFSEAWHGDLDANGRADLIVLHQFPRNGNCPDDPQLTVVMIDQAGRPVPWEIRSDINLRYALEQKVLDIALPELPPPGIAEFVDMDANRRAEFVQTECLGGETSIRAVYEVEDARWRQVDMPQPMLGKADYARALRGLTSSSLPGTSEHYFIPEVANAVSNRAPGVISRKFPRQGRCDAIPVPPAVNGTIPSDPRVWKAEEERNYRACNDAFVLEDGRTCFGYPAIVIDRPAGREAQMVGKSPEAAALLDEIIEKRKHVVLTGRNDEDHCSPAVIWALDD